MLKPEDNERITRTSRGTPMGNLWRRYWVPALLSEELAEPDGPPLRVRLLNEDLIAFRDSDGKVGLVDAFCPHRRAPMFFGRNEECGLRCVYHGWKFDVNGTCVDMPSLRQSSGQAPPAVPRQARDDTLRNRDDTLRNRDDTLRNRDDTLRNRDDTLRTTQVTIGAYPTWEGGGMIWTYMGPPELQPPPPDYELVRAPKTHRFVSKTFEEANWLQALEGGLDTSHSSFAHNLDIKNKAYVRNADTAPRLEVERTPYGYTYAGIRHVEGKQYVRAYHFVMPAQQMRGRVSGRKGGIEKVPTINGHIWVPIDDETCWSYNWQYAYDPTIPVSREYAEEHETMYGRGPGDVFPGTFKLKRNLRNDYLIDRQLQKTQTFTGIEGINTQDMALQEGMGPIVDRSKEHLGTSDRAIIAMRQLLMEAMDAVESGAKIRGLDPADYRDVRAVDLMIPLGAEWREALKDELVAKF